MSASGSASCCLNDFGAPVLAVCGFSGSGKTTLLEAAVPHLIARGLSVAVVKHDSHSFSVDQQGKDSDRLFRAGATVALRGPSEQFQRRGALSKLTLEATLSDVARDHDLLLVEGHKDTTLPKLWLSSSENSVPPRDVTGVEAFLPWDSDRLGTFLDFVDKWLARAWAMRPTFAGMLVGGKSSRMGSPKQLIEFRGRALGEIAATALSSAFSGESCSVGRDGELVNPRLVVIGSGPVPRMLQNITRLADPPGLTGPLAGLLAAHRWNPRAGWMLAACDHPWLNPSDVRGLLDQRRPGAWAIIPTQPDGHPCPTLAFFEPQSLEVLERALLARDPASVRIAEIFDHPHTVISPYSTRGLLSANTPMELRLASACFQG